MPKGTPKKGSATWAPAARMATFDKKPGWKYRFCADDPDNLDRKQTEGWQIVNKTTGVPGEFNEEHNQTSGARKHRELILCAMPEETFEARQAYYRELTDRNTAALKKNLQSDLSKEGKAVAEGSIVIQ